MTKPPRNYFTPSRERVLKELKRRGLWFRVCSPEHLKVDNVNFWPGTGRIHVDGAPTSHPERGLTVFIGYVTRARRESAATPTAPELEADFTLYFDSSPATTSPKAEDPVVVYLGRRKHGD